MNDKQKLKNLKQRLLRAKNNNEWTKKYEKTEKGFLMRLYRNMMSRVNGIQHKKYHLYKGLTLLSRDEFYNWAASSVEFKNLFKEWEERCYDRKKTPSVDRIDSSRGYIINNMEWVTHSENSRRGSISKRRFKK